MKKKDMDDKKEEVKQTSDKEPAEKETGQNNSFWKKLGSAVKKAVDCCLE